MPYVGHLANNPMQRGSCPLCGGNAGPNQPTCQTCAAPLFHPKVVVLDVGQGNCNAIVGATGKILAYFDFGYSTTGARQPAPPTRPCFCDRPPIVLSHWDRDHINLAAHVPESLTADWLVPEQKHSSFATKLQKQIKQAGGRLLVWPKTSEPFRHVVFPWGYVEHGTEDPNRGPNGSGLAAFVCVQEVPGAAHQQRGAAPQTIQASADLAVVVRARQAATDVGDEVWRLVHGEDERRSVRRLAKPLAAVLAASQTNARRLNMPVGECVSAAVRAAKLAIAGVAHAPAATTLDQVSLALPTLRAANPGQATTVLQELARAATDAHGQRGRRRRYAAAAARLTADGSIPAALWPRLGDGAARARGAVPTLRAGRGPSLARERFVLLNGDADFRWLPSMTGRVPPVVSGLTAMHHGAVFEDGEPLSSHYIPYAPGSWEARAVSRFNPAAFGWSMISMVAEAGRALCRGSYFGRMSGLRTAASRAAHAAVAAIHAVEATHAGDLLHDPLKFAYAAAAASVTAWRTVDPSAIALATVLASTVEKLPSETGCSPLEGVVDLAVEAVRRARLGGAIPAVDAQTISKGAIDGWLVTNHVANMATNTTGAVGPGVSAPNCGQEAASLLTYLWNNYTTGLAPKDRSRFRKRMSLEISRGGVVNLVVDVLNDLADAAAAAMYASRHGQPKRLHPRTYAMAAGARLGVVGSGLRRLRDSITATLDAPHGVAPGGVEGIARTAAFVAAVRAVAYILGRSPEAILTVIDAARTAKGRAASRRALAARREPLGGRIAYSYGVHNGDSSHEYPSLVAGSLGHPHPLAIEKYVAHGWTRRRNASARANHAGLQGDRVTAHSHGHVALMWDSRNGRYHLVGRDKFQCPACSQTFVLHR